MLKHCEPLFYYEEIYATWICISKVVFVLTKSVIKTSTLLMFNLAERNLSSIQVNLALVSCVGRQQNAYLSRYSRGIMSCDLPRCQMISGLGHLWQTWPRSDVIIRHSRLGTGSCFVPRFEGLSIWCAFPCMCFSVHPTLSDVHIRYKRSYFEIKCY